MQEISFFKMHGCGNDFLIIDNRKLALEISAEKIQELADRKRSIGFDQLLLIENSDKADCFMRIYNADGGEASACGNGSRCIAKLMFEESNKDEITIETIADTLICRKNGKQVTVNMGTPREVRQESKTEVKVNIGNDHIVVFSDYFDSKYIKKNVNINVVKVVANDEIHLTTYERGVGETLACGSGACASLLASVEAGLSNKKAKVVQKGGDLIIELLDSGEVMMTGNAVLSFRGELTL